MTAGRSCGSTVPNVNAERSKPGGVRPSSRSSRTHRGRRARGGAHAKPRGVWSGAASTSRIMERMLRRGRSSVPIFIHTHLLGFRADDRLHLACRRRRRRRSASRIRPAQVVHGHVTPRYRHANTLIDYTVLVSPQAKSKSPHAAWCSCTSYSSTFVRSSFHWGVISFRNLRKFSVI